MGKSLRVTASSTRVLELMRCTRFAIRNDDTPYNLKCPEPLPVVFSKVFMMNACHAGAPAGRSDGSWIQAQSADVT
eukprot:8817215-Pyramimonas_sp.AAC.1